MAPRYITGSNPIIQFLLLYKLIMNSRINHTVLEWFKYKAGNQMVTGLSSTIIFLMEQWNITSVSLTDVIIFFLCYYFDLELFTV